MLVRSTEAASSARHRSPAETRMFAARHQAATAIPTFFSKAPGRLGFAMAMLASSARGIERGKYKARGDGSRGTAAVLRGCVMEGLFTETNRATERVLVIN